jgi:hypothetical protein
LKLISHWIALALFGMASLVLFNGCEQRPQYLAISVFVDGSDLIKVNGNKLWIEHESASLPGETVHVNGAAWIPRWNDKVSTSFEGVVPMFKPRDPQRIQVTKRAGRGTAGIVEAPTAKNNGTLVIRVEDNDFGGADWYDVLVSW